MSMLGALDDDHVGPRRVRDEVSGHGLMLRRAGRPVLAKIAQGRRRQPWGKFIFASLLAPLEAM
jgi:hypothetical protein